MYSVQYHTVALSYRYHKYYIYIFQQYDLDCYRCKYSTVDGGAVIGLTDQDSRRAPLLVFFFSRRLHA